MDSKIQVGSKVAPDWGKGPILPSWARWLIRGSIVILWLLMRPVTAFRAFWRGRRLKPPPAPPGVQVKSGESDRAPDDAQDSRLLFMTAGEISAAVRAGEVSCQQVVAAYAARVRAVNPSLNAVVAERLDAAEKEAADLDRRLKDEGKEGQTLRSLPLLGVPLTVKGSIALQGLPHRTGMKESPCVQGSASAPSDAPIVARLRAAGAVPLLVSNVPELCMWWETRNKRQGTTRNPYSPTRTVGGSSGGEAALLAAAASVLSIGSDVGGSLRLPAFFCGVFGHKPTPLAVPIDGHMPECSDPVWPKVFTLGPMSRYSADLPTALSVMAGPNSPDLRLDVQVPLQSLRVLAVDTEPGGCSIAEAVDPVLRDAVKRAADSLAKAGATLEQPDLTGLRDLFFVSTLLLLRLQGIESPFYNPHEPSKARGVFSELVRYIFMCSDHSLYTIMFTMMNHLAHKTPAGLVRRCEKRAETLRNFLTEILGKDGVMLYPSWTCTAPQDLEIAFQMTSSTYIVPFNMLGLPTTQVPMGLGPDGMPIGIQVVAAPMQDRLCLAVANHLEKAFGGWSPPWARTLSQ